MSQYLEILKDNVPDAKVALLGMQSFSAWLLFATAADACGSANDNVLSRACVLQAAADVQDWTAGGLHAPTDPGPEGGQVPTCEMQLTVADGGAFERLFPEIGSDQDDTAGFNCAADAVVDVPANEGLAVVSPDQPI